ARRQACLGKWSRTGRSFIGRNLLRRAYVCRQRAELARENDRRTRARADTELHRLYLEVCASSPGSGVCAAVDPVLLPITQSSILAGVNVFLISLRNSLTNAAATVR